MPSLRPSSVVDTSYLPPRGTVLLLTCMDLRLLDEIIQFMNHDNLVNRYDHVVFAGAALGALGAPCAKSDFSHWKKTFFDHLGAAVELHRVEDVYILEHRNCGAYHAVFKACPNYGDSEKDQAAEEACHLKYAELLQQEIETWAKQLGIKLRVTKFLMDLRGQVTLLSKPKPKSPSKKSAN